MFESLIPILLKYGYLGAFLSGFLSTFTIFIPSPTFVVVIMLAGVLNPFFLGLFGGLGAAIGEFIGYYFGYGTGTILNDKIKAKLLKMMKKYHPMIIIFIFAANPFVPFDAAGIFFGSINYDAKKFFIATVLGKILKYMIIAYSGHYGISIIKYSLSMPNPN